jgi:hypothetical protein
MSRPWRRNSGYIWSSLKRQTSSTLFETPCPVHVYILLTCGLDGFILPQTSLHDDEVRLDHVILPRLTEGQQNALKDVGFLGGYALLPGSGELCFKTQVAVRSVLLTANEWEHFMGSGEDLADDKESDVYAWLTPSLESYVQEANEAIGALKSLSAASTGDVANKLKLLQARWEQIRAALMDFLE